MNWYTMIYPGPEGKLLYLKGHNHHNLLSRSFLFNAAASKLGLSCPRFCRSKQPLFEPVVVPLQDTGIPTFEALESLVLNKSREVARCVLNPSYWMEPGGVAYDRAPTIRCTNWTLYKNAKITSLTFLKYHMEHKQEPWLQTFPTSLPMHSNWFLFISSHRSSCYVGTRGSTLEDILTSATLCTTSKGERTFTRTSTIWMQGTMLVLLLHASLVHSTFTVDNHKHRPSLL